MQANKNIVSGFIGASISIILLWYLYTCIDKDTFFSVISIARFHINDIVVASILYVVVYIFRAWRFNLLIQVDKINLTGHLAVVSLHSFLNHIMPFRTGELSYLYFRNKYHNLSYSEGTASLFLARIFDIIALFLWGLLFLPFIFSSEYIGNLHVPGKRVAIFIALILFVFLAFVFYFFFFRKKIITESKSLSVSKQISQQENFYTYLHRFAAEVFKHSTSGHHRRNLHLLAISSLLIWMFIFLYFFCMLHAFHSEISFLHALFPAYGTILGNLLPINGIGSLGTFESGFVLGYITTGTASNVSVSIAFLVHAHAIIVGLGCACWGWFVLHKNSRALH